VSAVAIVIPWFGRNVVGGAELHAWHLASRLASRNHSVEVLTTCCRSHADDWGTNHYPVGQVREIEGFCVRRFAVKSRDRVRFDSVNRRLLEIEARALRPGVSPVSKEDEEVFLHQLIRSPTLLAYLSKHKDEYDAVILLPYLYGLVIEGIHVAAERALLLPCLHNEAYAYLPSVARSVLAAQRLIFLSEGERALAVRLFGPGVISKSIVAGAGVEIDPGEKTDDSLLPRMGGARYVLCLGRKDPGKKTDFLARCFERYRRGHGDLQLVIAGPGDVVLPSDCPGLIEFGVVSDAQKWSLLRNCVALFHPSENESYSRVIMEAWVAGRPAAANRNCLATSTAISQGGGWLASTAEEWISLFATIEKTSDAQLAAIGEKGRQLAGTLASWETAIGRYEDAIEGLRSSLCDEKSERIVGAKASIHQILPNVAYGDAISNHAIWIKHALRKLGHCSEIFALWIDPPLASEVRRLTENCLRPSDAIIYHHSIGSAVTPAVLEHRGPKCLIYHNITPDQYLEPYLPLHAKLCREGRNQLPQLAPHFVLSAGDSQFNATELAEAGFHEPKVLPLCVDPAKWQLIPDAALMERLQDGRTNVLFVGRLSPHKRHEDLIYAFSKFRGLDPSARLILVGTPVVRDDFYFACLERLCEKLGLQNAVEFSGHVSDEALLAYYRTAHLFWSMSEHEGFCIPLIEAMWFDMPVFAYASSAVPETMGGFGRMFSSKADFNALAEQAFRLARDSAIRAEVIAGQQTRRAVFLESRVVRHLESLLSKLVPAVDAPIHAPLRLVTSADTRRIAVVKLDHIGDLLLASPVFNSLHQRFPEASITAVVAPGSAAVLQNHPRVTECVPYDAPWFWRDPPTGEALTTALARNDQSMRYLLQGHFDLVVNLRSDLANVLFAASLPHTHLLSYTNHSPYAFLVTHPLTRSRGMHICDQHRALLAEIGAKDWSPPRLYPSRTDYLSVTNKVRIEPGTVAIFPGAGIPLKRWAPIKFRELARRLRLRGTPVSIVGAEADRALGAEVAGESGASNLCGEFSLQELSVFLEKCSVLVTNDSAPMHIGAAAGIALVYLSRPNTAEEFAPIGSIQERCCASRCAQPCEGFDAEKRGDLRAFCSCLQKITVEEVESKVLRALALLDSSPSRQTARQSDFAQAGRES
jgi:glycosyltransferase involved in cell wall biosynthesis/ADP-heptose:LPS heptosyltransferase